ncbi:MAG: hypothetical protein GX995_07315 [Clostridiales bacterium]|nr:hypothetical protein [Clostridiales bacterium]
MSTYTLNIMDGINLTKSTLDVDLLEETFMVGKFIHPLGYSRAFLFAFDHDMDFYKEILRRINEIWDLYVDRKKLEKTKTIDEFVEATEKRFNLILELDDLIEKKALECYNETKAGFNVLKRRGLFRLDKDFRSFIKEEKKKVKFDLRIYGETIPDMVKISDKEVYPILLRDYMPELRELAEKKKKQDLELKDVLDEFLQLEADHTYTGQETDKIY